MTVGNLVRYLRLSAEERHLLWRAAFTLTAASAAVAFLPFRRAIRFGAIPLGQRRSIGAERCAWAIEAASRRLPWRTACIEKGLAGQRILRSSGVEAVLHYGARHQQESGNFEAHVWVTVLGKPVIGGDEVESFAPVAIYPSEPI